MFSYMKNINLTLMFVYDNNTQTSYLGNVAVDYQVTKADFPDEIPDSKINYFTVYLTIVIFQFIMLIGVTSPSFDYV